VQNRNTQPPIQTQTHAGNSEPEYCHLGHRDALAVVLSAFIRRYRVAVLVPAFAGMTGTQKTRDEIVSALRAPSGPTVCGDRKRSALQACVDWWRFFLGRWRRWPRL